MNVHWEFDVALGKTIWFSLDAAIQKSSLIYAVLSTCMQRPYRVSLKNIFADIEELAFIGQITFTRNFDNNWNKNVNFSQLFKNLLTNDDLFLQMYCSEMNFLTYWFLKIKWDFVKFVKTTKEMAIDKNGFSQSL